MPIGHNGSTMNLSYVDMNMAKDGSVLTRDQIREERERQGFCTECHGRPVRLYNITRARFNPLWSTKEPCTVAGESLNGQCLQCHPRLDPNYKLKSKSRRRDGKRRPVSADSANGAFAPGTSSSGGRGAGNQNYSQSMMNLQNRTARPPSGRGSPPAAAAAANLSPNGASHTSLLRSPVVTTPNDASSSSLNAPQNITVNPREIPIVPDLLQASANRVATEDAVVFDGGEDSGGDLLVESEAAYDDVDEDNMEIMFAECRRRSVMRNLRQPSIANLASPPNDVSPAPSHAIRKANSSQRNLMVDNSTGIRARSNRNIYVPPSPPPLDDTTPLPPPPPPESAPLHPSRSPSTTPARRPPSPPQRRVSPPPQRRASPPLQRRASPPLQRRASPPLQRRASPPLQRRASPPPQPSASPPPAQSAEVDHTVLVAGLESLIKDVSMAGNADFTADIIVGAMQDHKDSVPVQLFCLGTIWDLCKDGDENKASFISSSAPDDILLCMKRHLTNAGIQERACGALWSLSVNQQNRVIIIRAGATARVIKTIVEHVNDPNVIRTAVGCLRTLSPESEVRASIGTMDGIKHVCSAMLAHPTSTSIQRDGCAFLSNSAVDLAKQQVAIASDYEFEAIVSAMIAHKSDPSVMAGACFSLKNYTYEERNVRSLASFDNIVSLLEHTSLYSQDSNGRRDASIVLERIQNQKEEDANLEKTTVTTLKESPPLSVEGALDVLKEHEWSPKVTAAVFACLVSLSRGGVGHRTEITGAVLSDVISKMRKMASSADVQINGCSLLEAMADFGYPLVTLIQKGAVEAVVAAMRKHEKNVDVQIAATALLKLLSTKFECWFELQQYDVHPVMEVLAANADSASVQVNGSEIMTNLSAHNP